MDYEKKYNEALERAKEIKSKILYSHLSTESCKAVSEYIDTIIPELTESEDERIIKWLIKELETRYVVDGVVNNTTAGNVLAYLKKQKERKEKEIPKWMPKFLDELRSKKHYFDWDEHRDIEGSILAIINFIAPNYFKQKEQKPNIEICPHSIKSKSYKENGYPIEDCDYGLEIALSILEKTLGKVQGYQTDDGIREHQTAIKAVKDTMKEQKPEFYPGNVVKCTLTGSLWVRCKEGDNIRSDGHTACIGGGFELASEEEAVQFFQELTKNGYHWDCIKGRPIKKEQKPAEKDAVEPAPKQDYSKLNSLERAIHRGFLCAGVENVPVEIIKETAQDCLAQIKPAEWSEEDDALLKEIVSFFKDGTVKLQHDLDLYAGFLQNKFKSLHPQLKQEWSEEDEKRIKQLIYDTEYIRAEYEKRKKELGESFNDELIKDCDEQISWLKSLRPQPHWKPSREQLEALGIAMDRNDSIGYNLRQLYEQLKKLM